MAFASIPEALEDFRAGRMLVVVDDEDRENEGDLTIAATNPITPGGHQLLHGDALLGAASSAWRSRRRYATRSTCL